VTDVNGQCVIALFPNELGSVESSYTFKITGTQGKTASITAVVPNVTEADLESCSVLPLFPGKVDGQLALEAVLLVGNQAQQAAIDAQQAANDASASATAAIDASTNSATSASASEASALSASGSATAANTAFNNAQNSANDAADSAAAAAADLAALDVTTVVRTVGAQEIGGPKTFTDFAEGAAVASGNQFPRANETVLKAGVPQVMSVDLTVPSINGGQLAGELRKNLNGDCVIAQTGTSFVIPANSGTFTLDGWEAACAGAAAITVTQSTDVPAGSEFQFSHRVTINTADTSIGANEYVGVWSRVEGDDARDLVGVPIAISFWVRSAKTGVHGIGIQNIGLDRSYVATFTVNVDNVW
jgi:hypothetical protein